jgi:hypothetical protein
MMMALAVREPAIIKHTSKEANWQLSRSNAECPRECLENLRRQDSCELWRIYGLPGRSQHLPVRFCDLIIV